MKNLYLIGLLMLLAHAGYSQYTANKIVWLDFGGHVELGNSNLLNKNMRKDQNLHVQTFNSASNYGANLGLRFREKFAIIGEASLCEASQLYQIKHPEKSYHYAKKLNIKTLNAGLFFRYTSFFGLFAEAGPNVLLLDEVYAKFKGNYPPEVQFNQTARYSALSFQAMTGLGIRILTGNSNRLQMNMGARVYFSATDLMEQTIDSPVSDDIAYVPNYNPSKPSTLINAIIRLEISYAIASFEKTTSGTIRINAF